MNRSALLFCIIAFASCGGDDVSSAQEWVRMGLDGKQVRSVVRASNTLYAATFGSGVYYSEDAGANWTALNNGLTDLNVYTVIVEDDMLLAGTQTGVFSKLATENEWKLFSTSLPAGTRAYSLYTFDGNLYVGSRSAVFMIPFDNSGTHVTISTGFPSEPYVIFVHGYDYKLFAGTQEGLFIWEVNSWELQSEVSTATVGKIGFSDDEIYVPTDGEGVFRFANGTWTEVNEGLSSLKAFVAIVNEEGVVYCGTANGVFRKANAESAWVSLSAGLPANTVVNSLTISGNDLIAGTETGVFRLSLN